MKGLVLKDFYSLKKMWLSILILLGMLFFLGICLNNSSMLLGMMMGISAVFGMMMPLTCFSYDNLYHWDAFGLALPLKRSQIVLSRYFFSGIVIIAAACIAAIGGTLVVLFQNGSTEELRYTIFGSLAMGVVFASIILPLIYRFGPERGRLVMIILFLGIFGVSFLIGQMNPEWDFSLPQWLADSLWIILPLALAVLAVLSYMISCWIYEKKEIVS